MWPALSAAVVLACSLMTLVTHRLVVEREQGSRIASMRTQAQALGHGGMMWALARMDDQRPLDSWCRPAPPDGQGTRFADLVMKPQARVSCTVDLGPGAPSGAAGWDCRCAAHEDDDTSDRPDSGDVASIVLDFAVASSQALELRVTATLAPGSTAAVPWRETIRLRQDARAIWRAVVGTWWDDRS